MNGYFLPPDTRAERSLRVGIILISMIIEGYVIDHRCAWARIQNSSYLTADPQQLIDYPLMSALTVVVGILGQNLRIWSWVFVCYCVVRAYWTTDHVYADDGAMFTRAYYEETILRVAFSLAGLGFLALIAVMVRSIRDGSRPKVIKILLGGAIVPVWVMILLFMR